MGRRKVPQTAIQRHRTSAQGVASGNPQQKTPHTETTAPKLAGIPKKDAPEAFREMAEKGTTQAKETYDKMNAATTEAADLIKNSYSKAVKGMQDYNNKIIEFAHADTNAAFDFVQKLSGVNSPTAFVELWTEHACKQVETLTEQSKQLVALALDCMRCWPERELVPNSGPSAAATRKSVWRNISILLSTAGSMFSITSRGPSSSATSLFDSP